MLAVLREGIKIPTAIVYAEEMKRGKVEARILKKHARLLAGLQKLQPNLSFTQHDMKKALRLLGEENHQTWWLSENELEDFSKRVAWRLRVMCSHLSAALRRKRPPAWVASVKAAAAKIEAGSTPSRSGSAGAGSLPGADGSEGSGCGGADGSEGNGCGPGPQADEDDEDDSEGSSEGTGPSDHEEHDEGQEDEGHISPDEAEGSSGEDPAPPPAAPAPPPAAPAPRPAKKPAAAAEKKTWFVGWDAELKQAWRVPTDDMFGVKDFAKWIHAPEGKSPMDNVVASWEDGYRHEVAGVTVAQWQSMRLARKRNSGAANLWRDDSGWFVRAKQDRHGRRMLWVGHTDDVTKQRVQLRAEMVPSEADGIEIMSKCALQLKDGVDDVYPLRDQLLCTLRGYPVGTRVRSIPVFTSSAQPVPETHGSNTTSTAASSTTVATAEASAKRCRISEPRPTPSENRQVGEKLHGTGRQRADAIMSMGMEDSMVFFGRGCRDGMKIRRSGGRAHDTFS